MLVSLCAWQLPVCNRFRIHESTLVWEGEGGVMKKSKLPGQPKWDGIQCLPCLRVSVQLLAVCLSKQAGLQSVCPTAASYQEGHCWHGHVWLILLNLVGAAEELADLCLLAASWPVLHLLGVKASRTLLSTPNEPGPEKWCVCFPPPGCPGHG